MTRDAGRDYHWGEGQARGEGQAKALLLRQSAPVAYVKHAGRHDGAHCYEEAVLSAEGSLPEAVVDAVGLYQSESVSESGASIGQWRDSTPWPWRMASPASLSATVLYSR